MPKGFKNDLYRRTEFLLAEGLLNNGADLHRVREKRNELAHENKYANWSELDWALDATDDALQALGFVGTRPKYEFYAERSEGRGSTDPDVLIRWQCCYGLKTEGNKIIEVSWTESLFKDS